MRSFILVVVAGFLLSMGGLVYFWLQPSGGRRGGVVVNIPSAPVTLTPNDSGSPLGNGDDVVMKKYDQRTGELASEFLAKEYKPQRGGKIAVRDATARFHMTNGQILQIHGETGLFTGDKVQPDQKGGAPARAQAPSRGHLEDVTLKILDAAERETMTIVMNNASFDSESSTIFTEAYTDPVNGQEVRGDQVKVTIRSAETNPAGYDFDGRGLRIAWNERDRRLAKLDVAHGEMLVVKNPKGFAQNKTAASSEPAVKNTATAASQSTSQPVKGTKNSAPSKRSALPVNIDPPVYRATFVQQVRIVQNGQAMAVADRMSVDFWMGTKDDSSVPTTTPTTKAATQSTVLIPATLPTTGPTTVPATATSRPADESPIYIYWTGPLHVEPYAQAATAPGDSIVTLEGKPVVARQQGSEIHASKLVYRTGDGSLRGSTVPGEFVQMTSADAHGQSIIRTTALEYLAQAHPPLAILSGKSSAVLPAQAGGPGMNASWIDRCVLRFETLPDGRSAIKQADITGDVFIDHPQIKLNAQRLELAFDSSQHGTASKAVTKPTTTATTKATSQPSMQMNLKQLVASDSVHCQMKDSENKTQTIDCNTLTLLTDFTPDGKLVPRTVNADGEVHAVDADQDLRAGHLAVTLAPSTRPASTKPSDHAGGFSSNVDLQSLIAHDAVHVIGRKDGTEAFADTMLIDKKAGKPTIKFVGQPFAKIIQKSNIITGSVIDLSPDGQQLSVDGGGTMHGSQQQSPGVAAKPIDVRWTRSLRVDGKRNIVDALGEVVATSVDTDGTVDTAHGDRAQLFLADVPATQPTTLPASTTQAVKATSRPATQEAAVRKIVRQAIFQDNASISSTLLDNNGQPQRRMNLLASIIQYDLVPVANNPNAPPMKKMTVPVGGRMLVEDYRAAATQPAGGGSDMAGARGATAFQWANSLTYDDATHKAVMQGNVVIDHRDDAQKEDSLRLTGDIVTAELEPVATTKPTAATSQPAETRFQVRRITARGNLIVTMRGGELRCDRIEYNPITHLLTAYGTETSDAVFSRTGPGVSQPIHAAEMQWDAKADLPKITRMSAQFRK